MRQKIPLDRAKMRIRLSAPSEFESQLRLAFTPLMGESLQSAVEDEEVELIGLIDPGDFRKSEELLSTTTKGSGSLEVLTLKEIDDGEV